MNRPHCTALQSFTTAPSTAAGHRPITRQERSRSVGRRRCSGGDYENGDEDGDGDGGSDGDGDGDGDGDVNGHGHGHGDGDGDGDDGHGHEIDMGMDMDMDMDMEMMGMGIMGMVVLEVLLLSAGSAAHMERRPPTRPFAGPGLPPLSYSQASSALC